MNLKDVAVLGLRYFCFTFISATFHCAPLHKTKHKQTMHKL